MKTFVRKTLKVFVTAALCLGMTMSARVIAEPDYSDSEYWGDRCTGKIQMTQDEKTACQAYAKYLSSQNDNLSDRLDEVEAMRKQYEADIAMYKDEIAALNASIESKQAEIDAKLAEIDAKQVEIDAKIEEVRLKQGEIDATQDEVDSLRKRVMDRMEAAQPTMRLSKYLDILMGASTFTDFIRIANGLQSITDYDNMTLDQLSELMELLKQQKIDLEQAQAELEAQMVSLELAEAQLEYEQADLEVMKYQAQVAKEAAETMAARMEAEGNRIAGEIEAANAAINSIAAAGVLGAISASAGWTFPVPGSYRSAGTWAYPGGSTHLGYDFAAAIGTNIYAVANGVILYSADSCSTYGYLGSSCGYPGSTGGGNQVYQLATVNGDLYAIKYLHMMSGTPIATGTVVSAGQIVGRVGTSGNSSGGHCHIEIFYLGDASNFEYYAQHWNGDLSFGAGWAGSDRRCDDGYGAPCRIRPENVFGG